ncbi:MAG: hypothetical protein WC748_04955 [Legionellales bacterium]|jgi:uncharacterized protein (UPF0147 family)
MFDEFISSTTPMPSPVRKKAKTENSQNNILLLAQAIGHAELQLEQYSQAVDCLVGFCEKNYAQASSDELLQITRLFSKLSNQLAFNKEYEALQRLQQVAQHFTRDENAPDYIRQTANENATLIEKHKEQILSKAPEAITTKDALLAQIIGYLELGENNYANAIKLLSEFCKTFDKNLTPNDKKNLTYIYQRYSKSILSLHNIELSKALQFVYSSLISKEIKEDYYNNYLSIRYEEFQSFFAKGHYQEALSCFLDINPLVALNDLPRYYIVLADVASGSELSELQNLAKRRITSNDSEYLTKYYYKQAILNLENPAARIEALKTCIEHAKERSSTAPTIHRCVASLEKLMPAPEFAAYKQKLIDGLYFGMIDDNQRTLCEWRYFDHKQFHTQDWLLLINAVKHEIMFWKKNTTFEQNFVENMNYMLDTIAFTKNHVEQCGNFYDTVDAQIFHKENPGFLDKFEEFIKKNMPGYSQSATTSPTISNTTLASAATSQASAAAVPQITLSPRPPTH